MKQELTLSLRVRTRLGPCLLLASTIVGCGFGVREGFGLEHTVTLEFSTFVGSTGCSYATLREATVDSAGNILAVGRGVYSPTRFPGATVHTYGPLGGSGNEIAEHRIAVDRGGISSLVGYTDSRDFPTAGQAHQRNAGGGGDGYLAKFAPDGKPIFITYIGGSGDELPNGPAMDSAGRVFVTGFTTSADFEVTPNAYDSTYGGGRDMFLQIYSPTGQLLYSTLAGGKADDGGRFVTTDANGNPVIVGRTLSRQFPTTSDAYDRDFAGSEDIFCMKFNVSWTSTPTRRSNN